MGDFKAEVVKLGRAMQNNVYVFGGYGILSAWLGAALFNPKRLYVVTYHDT